MDLGLGGGKWGAPEKEEGLFAGQGAGARMFWNWIFAQLCDCTKNIEL